MVTESVALLIAGAPAARCTATGPGCAPASGRNLKLRAERVGRGFAHSLDRGGMRRAWLRGRDNVHKRYLLHVAAYNLGLVMRVLLGAGTPRELAAKGGPLGWFLVPAAGFVVILLPPPDAPPNPTSSTGC
jgi:hypothetical protein